MVEDLQSICIRHTINFHDNINPAYRVDSDSLLMVNIDCKTFSLLNQSVTLSLYLVIIASNLYPTSFNLFATVGISNGRPLGWDGFIT